MRCIVEGQPIGKGRPRFTLNGRAYTPEKTRKYEKAIVDAWKEQNGDEPIFGAVNVCIEAYYGIAKSDSKKARRLKLDGYTPCMVKPDIDNVCKAVLDALPWEKDDTQVIILNARKYWSEHPRVEITVTQVEEDNDGF